ncbi:MAG: diguanylate cyclase [Candidatus Bipolaricaulota bacterium]|nr:diguanylate cyclase [Candidatus Bipolaricaulota bacterium]MDW8126246.1 diguanylate cyclase [Candidatus Bipolaricaulota bacterium]
MRCGEERELAVVAAVAKASLSGQDPKEFCQQVLAGILPVLGLDAGAVYLLHRSQFVLLAHYGLSSEFVAQASVTPRDHPWLGRAVRERRTLWVQEFSSPVTRAEGMKAAVLLPLVMGEKELGVLAVGTRCAWEPTPSDQRALELAAHIFALSLTQKLETSEKAELLARYQNFVENEIFGVYIVQDGRFAFVNEGLAKILGYRREELLNRPCLEVIHPDDRARITQGLEAQLKEGSGTRRRQVRVLAQDGSVKVVEIQTWPIQLSGQPAVQGVARDVTWEAQVEKLRQDLLSVATEILAGTDVSAILRRVAQAVVEHSPFRRAVVTLYDLRHEPPFLGPTVAIATAGLTAEEEEQLRSQGGLPPHHRAMAFQEEFRIGQSYYISHDRVPWEPTYGLPGRNASDGWHPDDFLFIPLRGRLGIIGHISVDEPVTPKAPTLEMLEPIELFAGLAALAVERAFQLEELRRHKEWLRGAFRLAHELGRCNSLEELLSEALGTLAREVRYEFGAILLRKGGELEVAATHSSLPGFQYTLGQRIPLTLGVVGWVATHRQPLRLNDVLGDPRYVPVHPEIRAELAVPILFGEEVLGVVDVESVTPGRFRPEDEEFLAAVSDLLGTAIESLRARETLRELSLRDPLTNLYNRRYLLEVLAREIGRAHRYGHPFSLAILDLDEFRKVNNRFGHATGDAVLQGVAEILLRNLRACDYVFRYGGDEFLLVLPETTRAGAEEAVARLRGRLRTWSRGLNLGFPLDFSVGIACFDPADPRPLEDLLREADGSLYAEKRARLG